MALVYALGILAIAVPWNAALHSRAGAALAWSAFMLRTFSFHCGLAMLLLAFLALALRQRALLAATVPMLALTLGPDVLRSLPRSAPTAAGETATVMSANLLAGNWTTEGFLKQVLANQPDVLLLQEYAPQWHAALQPALAETYPYSFAVTRRDSYGLAVYAKRPFEREPDIALPLLQSETPQARTVIRIDGRDVAIYNIHLRRPHLRSVDLRQTQEFADLIGLLKQEALPAVVCGDFNFTNTSAFAEKLRRIGFIDAHDLSGTGRGSTWPAIGPFQYLPGIRLDHVYLSKELTSTDSWVGEKYGSDHRPVIAEIGFGAR